MISEEGLGTHDKLPIPKCHNDICVGEEPGTEWGEQWAGQGQQGGRAEGEGAAQCQPTPCEG